MSKKRRLWQIHLSTAIMIMVVAGLFIWANMRVHFSIYNQHKTTVDDQGRKVTGLEVCASLGWPQRICYYGNGMFVHADDPRKEAEIACRTILYDDFRMGYYSESKFNENVTTGLILLIVVLFASEYFIRRRKPQP